MRIGIITFWKSQDNYGEKLQLFAMQRFLTKLGNECFLIRYEETHASAPGFSFSRILKYLRNIKNIKSYIAGFLAIQKRKREIAKYGDKACAVDRHFDEFLAENIEMSDVYSAESIVANPPIADAYVCGSDQVWGGNELAFYLNFAPEKSIKIAYAPSLGGRARFAPEVESQIAGLISGMNFVGVREQSGVETCHRLGIKNAVKVVDPTILLQRGDYDTIRIPVKKPKRYILLYLLGNPIAQKTEEFYTFAKSRNCEVIYVASQGKYDAFDKFPAQVGEWIDLIADAEMVITNSFHCTVFALIYGRQFITVPLCGSFKRMNTRIEELLSESGLENRMLESSLDEASRVPAEFARFEAYKNKETDRSQNYLLETLQSNQE